MVKGFYSPPSASAQHTHEAVEAITGTDSDANSGLVVGEGEAGLRTDGTTQLNATNEGVTMRVPHTVVTPAGSPYSVSSSDAVILVNTASGSVEINLPAASTVSNRMFIIKDVGDAYQSAITLNASSGNIDGFASILIENQKARQVVFSDGTDYWLL